MDGISQQLLYQRLRNRVIEALDLYCSFDDLAKLGAFSAINMVEDWLPLNYEAAGTVFDQKEKNSVSEFIRRFNVAADATDADIWSNASFESAPEWVRLSETAKNAFIVFSERGRFSEECEEVTST